MWKNYLKIAWRKLNKGKAFSVIHITGLSISLACVMLIYMYISHELSYDRFHEKADRIYRVYLAYDDLGDTKIKAANTPPILIPALKEEIPEIDAVRLSEINGGVVMRHQDKVFKESQVYSTDSSFFTIFSASFLAGDPLNALTQPHAVVLSSSTAAKYFDNASQAIGKTLEITAQGETPYLVTGVVEDFPQNSHFQFDALLSMDYGQENHDPQNWLAHSPYAYILLPENMDASTLEDKIRVITERALDPVYEHRFGRTYEAHKAAGGLQEYRLQPLSDIRLYSADIHDRPSASQTSINHVYLFAGIGLMLISIAVFNYINLSTAQSMKEAKSTGIRKVFGATKSQLYKLFLTESVGIAVAGAFLATIVVHVLLTVDHPFLSRFIPQQTVSPSEGLALIAIALLVGAFSGYVPARMISAFQPARVLKGQLVQGKKGGGLRQILVIAQFTVSIGLIICTMLISQQLAFLQNTALGFDKEQLLAIKNMDKLGDSKTTFKEILNKERFVTQSTLSYNVIGSPHNNAAFTPVELIEQGKLDVVHIPVYIGDEDYLQTLGVELLMGSPFPPNLPKERQQILLNETALHEVGWHNRPEEELIGQIIDVNGLRYELAGIVKDYHFTSLREKIGPMAIFSHYYQGYDILLTRVNTDSYQQVIQNIEKHWQQLAPHVPFEYSFVDQDLEDLYQSEQDLAVLFSMFAGLTVFIACLGLLGLTMFSAERRVKEIGVRKTLGASVANIVLLLSKDQLKLIMLAMLIATPLAGYAMSRWLEDFAYQIDIEWWVFGLAGLVAVAIALLATSFQSVRAALANPVESLRNE